MPTDVFGIDAAGKFFLVAVQTLVGSILRIRTRWRRPGSADVTGRSSARWYCGPDTADAVVRDAPGTSYTTFLLVAATAGVGGGKFASSMANINAFYPQASRGGHSGSTRAAATSACGDPVGGSARHRDGRQTPHRTWCARSTSCSSRWRRSVRRCHGQPDGAEGRPALDARSTAGSGVVDRQHFLTSVRSARSSGSVSRSVRCCRSTSPVAAHGAGRTARRADRVLGPLLGSIARPLGGRLADRIGGGRITLWTFAAMVLAAAVLVAAGTADGAPPAPRPGPP